MNNMAAVDILTYLRKKPDPSSGFKPMTEWADISDTLEDQEARSLYLQARQITLDFDDISNHRSEVKLLTFLRYDYKKVLVRTRYLYLDRILNPASGKLEGHDLDFAFFEPILLCFPNLEFIGRLNFPDLYNVPTKNGNTNRNTSKILQRMLQEIGGGYNDCAKELVDWHRHALSHELRPDGNWTYDLNTEEKYGPPKRPDGMTIYLNIPHFIDSCLLEIEKLCEAIIGPHTVEVMNKIDEYISKRFHRKHALKK